jgi:hypothetical protein
MRRRDFIAGLAGAAAAWPLGARAQQGDQVRGLLNRILRTQAENAAEKIGNFIREIESQMGWTTQLPWSAGTLDQRRFDGLRLLRQVPAVAEFAQLDPSGKEQLRVSRLAMDMVANQIDFSQDPKFTVAVAKRVYYGPVYFRREASLHVEFSEREQLSGLGLDVAMENGLIKVVTPIDELPAAKAGILADDVIIKLDDDQVQGLTLNQAVEKLRGPAGAKIKLTIVRKGNEKPIEVLVTRDVIRPSSRVGRAVHERQDMPVRVSEPYMTLSLAGIGRDTGVSVVEVDLKLIVDLVRTTKIVDHGAAYIVDAQGRVIAHPDSNLIQRDFSSLSHVQAARAAGFGPRTGAAQVTRDINGREVLATYEPVEGPNWLVFVELPVDEANAQAQ